MAGGVDPDGICLDAEGVICVSAGMSWSSASPRATKFGQHDCCTADPEELAGKFQQHCRPDKGA